MAAPKTLEALLMYVGGLLAVGPTRIVERVLTDIQKQWKMSIKGILVRDGEKPDFKAESLRFLGCMLEVGPDNMIRLHQIEYIKE